MRGYFGIGILNPLREVNYGTLFRSAFGFGADFTFLVGGKFDKQSSDTTRSERHLPLFRYRDIEDFVSHIPYSCSIVCVELSDNSINIKEFAHPERAVYILGPENGSLPLCLTETYPTIYIPTRHCFNVSVAGSIVMYDRIARGG